jgi:hypothetical protein
MRCWIKILKLHPFKIIGLWGGGSENISKKNHILGQWVDKFMEIHANIAILKEFACKIWNLSELTSV